MTNNEKKILKELILSQIQILKEDIVQLQALLQPIKKNCSLDIIDHKILKQDQDINFQRYEVANNRLSSLQDAYHAIDNQ